MYRVGLQQDGHSSQQPFPQFDVAKFVDGLGDLLGSGDDTTAPAPTAPTPSTDTGKSDPIQATTSAKHPENSAPNPTAGSVTDPPQKSTTKSDGMIQHELLYHFTHILMLSRARSNRLFPGCIR